MNPRDLLGAGVLGDSLGALRDGVLGELTGEEEPTDKAAKKITGYHLIKTIDLF